MKSLQGKKILFISPKAFGYEKDIKKKLEGNGAHVDYFDERPSNKAWDKACIRINRTLIRKTIYQYYDKIIKANTLNKYDFIFFNHLETPFPDILENLKKSNPQGKYLLYMWDSMLNRPNTIELTKYFDSVFTFDRLDSIKYSFHFRPLFYLDEYAKPHTTVPIFDISFIGTVHSDRYRIINAIKKQANTTKLKSNWFLFMHNKLLFYKIKFSHLKHLKAKLWEFSFKSLEKDEVVRFMQQSKVIIDIQHPKNNGLTMRTIEALGMKKKLITTNNDIVNYDFYNPNNIYVIDRGDPKISKSFFETEYTQIEDDIYKKYSLQCWLDDLFSKRGTRIETNSKVSVSIVLYNTNEKRLNDAINSCLNSIISMDIYLIDNSPNNNLSYLRQDERVRYLKSGYNGGFGAGHNLGIHEFKILENYDYHLVMNPDIKFDANVIGQIVQYMEKHLTTGVLMPRILNTDGTLQFARRLLPKPVDIFMKRFFVNSSYARKYEMVFCEPNKPVEIVGLCGCFLFFSTKALKTAGLFDERYFMYFEDFDICRRVSKFYKTIYYPKVEVIHDSNREHRRNLKLFYCSIIATMKYFKKWGYIDKDRERGNARVYKQVADSES